MLVVLAELELDGPGQRLVLRQRDGGPGAVTASLDEGCEAQPFEPLGNGAPVPAELTGRGLHVEAVTPETGEHGRVPRFGPRVGGAPGGRRRQPEPLAREERPVAE